MKRTASDLSIIRTVSDLSTNTISLDFQFTGHKSLEYRNLSLGTRLEYRCLATHLTSVSNISYDESNGGIFILIAPLGITNRRTNLWTNVVRVICDH
jgi:hypothetical protein